MDNKELKEELIKFVMETANGIDDYDWGQYKFEKELREKLDSLLKSQRDELVGKIEVFRPSKPYPNASNMWQKELDDEDKNIDKLISDIINLIKDN